MYTYRYKLNLTTAQSARIDQWIGTCRYVYNLALETKINAYNSGRVNLSKFDLINQLPELKDIEWIADVPSQSLQNVCERLDSAYQAFFKGGGFPKFAKRGKYKSILFKSVKQENNGFILPKIGKVKIFKDRKAEGELKKAIITKEYNGYFICVISEVQSVNLYPTSENQTVGLDVGIAYLLVDSDGCFIENPHIFKKYEQKLRIENRSLSRKKRGSKSREKQRLRLVKLYAKIGNTRRDFLHKVSIKYVKENNLIVCEDLKVKNMIKFGHLSKSISDVSWATLFDMLEHKSKLYEKGFIKVDPKYTSRKCSMCGHTKKENRINQAKFKCLSCGHEQNADLNAAMNIMSEGIAQYRQRETLVCA